MRKIDKLWRIRISLMFDNLTIEQIQEAEQLQTKLIDEIEAEHKIQQMVSIKKENVL